MLDEAPHLRTMLGSHEACSTCEGVLCGWTDRLAESLDLPALLRLAEHRPLDALSSEGGSGLTAWLQGAGRSVAGRLPLKVAVAYDDAFHCYFPDTLDLLEARGATVCDFSPLREDSLPDDVDVVYLGCGCPEKFADALSENHCMKQSLRSYVETGGRVYAEGGGLAYLCQQMVLPTGRRLPMVGAVPAIAVRSPQPQRPQPAEVTLRDDNWLAERGSRFRGYLNSNWRIQSVGPLLGLAKEEALHTSLVGWQRVIGSRLHLNFAAHPAFLRRFFQPVAPVGHAAGR
jgi:cobyrinic acid a,c-diamide synthase